MTGNEQTDPGGIRGFEVMDNGRATAPISIVARTSENVALPGIVAIWAALGGSELRHGRGIAFWRQGADGYNVDVNADKGVWHDFVTDEGGGVLDLVELVLQCDRSAAWTWLRERFSLPGGDFTPEQKRAWARDKRDRENCKYWAFAAALLADEILAELPFYSLERAGVSETRKRALAPATQLSEYREWKAANPKLTAAMVDTGRAIERRREIRIANWLLAEVNRVA